MPVTHEGGDIATHPSMVHGSDGSALPKRMRVESDGSVVVRNLTADIKWDRITPTFNSDNDVYLFSYDGNTTATITVSYTDTTKEVLSDVTKVIA